VRTRALAFAAAGWLALAPIGCGSSSGTVSRRPEKTNPTTTVPIAAPGADGTVLVVVQDNDFTPQHLRVPEGTTVRWFNQGFSPHRIAPADPGQDFHGVGGVSFGTPADRFHERESYRFTFTTAGTYDYYCPIHGLPHARMFASVEVTRV